MTMSERSTVVGVFTERAQLDLAVEELQGAGFTNDQFKFLQPGDTQGGLSGVSGANTQGGVIGTIKRAFSGQGGTEGSIVDDLTSMGVPEEEAHYYQSEFEIGRIIIAVEAAARRPEALEIIRHNGGYDATTRQTYDPNASAARSDPPELR